MRLHLRRSARSTWCGRVTAPKGGLRGVVSDRNVVEKIDEATCLVCLKADAAETARNK